MVFIGAWVNPTTPHFFLSVDKSVNNCTLIHNLPQIQDTKSQHFIHRLSTKLSTIVNDNHSHLGAQRRAAVQFRNEIFSCPAPQYKIEVQNRSLSVSLCVYFRHIAGLSISPKGSPQGDLSTGYPQLSAKPSQPSRLPLLL